MFSRIKEALKKNCPLSWRDALIFVLVMLAATALCAALRTISTSDVHVPMVFVAAVLVISILTDGYFFGTAAAIISVFGVNWAFTYPYFKLNFSIYGYPLTFLTMLAVCIVSSTLMARIKDQEKIRMESMKETVRAILASNGYDVVTAGTGREAFSMISSHCPDLMILDLGLPDLDGMELIPAVREWSQMPIIVVSARTQEREKVAALDSGADDYLAKPFGAAELLVRVRVAIRHVNRAASSRTGNGMFTSGSLTVDYNKHWVLVDGENVRLTQNEYKIVALLSRNAGKVLTYDYIMKELWGPQIKGSNQILRVNMANIRRKIEKNPAEPKYIFTEVGVGYRMIEGE